ncbi:MAG: MFS transporter [bacterium]|nr:MFS transporter [bacterium]
MKNHLLAVLGNKEFLYLWLAEIFSQIAFNMVNFILLLIVFKLSNSNAAVSGMVLSFTIPAILFGIVAGAYVDRWNKKKVLFFTNISRAILLILLAVFHANIVFIYFLSFSMAVVTQFFIPAETPVIPLVVPKSQLFQANALFGMGLYGSMMIAYAISGIFLISFGSTYVFAVLALFFVVAAFFVSLIQNTKNGKGSREVELQIEPKLNVIAELKAALKLIAKTKQIYDSLFLLTLSQVIVLLLAAIGPGFAHQVLGIPVDDFPLTFIAPATFGMVVGAIIIGNFLHNRSRKKMANLGVFLGGLSIMLLPYGSRVASRSVVQTINSFLPNILTINILHIMILLAFILGIASALIFVPSNTLLQEETSDKFRGRVYGTLNSLVGISSILPIIIVGELADIFGVGHVLSGIGLSLLIISFVRSFVK